MSVFDKKFHELLQNSEEYKQLKKRVDALEAQVVHLQKSLLDALQAYNNVARMTIDHRKSLEEIYSYLTDPLGEPDESSDPTAEMTPEELEEYKRNLN